MNSFHWIFVYIRAFVKERNNFAGINLHVYPSTFLFTKQIFEYL